MSHLHVRVTQLQAQGNANLSVRLEAVCGQALPAFSAGSHVDVFLPSGLIRQYSIASAPSSLDHYELCVKKEAASRGGSRFMHEGLALNTELEISRPRNLFAIQPAAHHVLVAAGIGITPLLSMAAELHETGQSFALHYYTRTRAEAAYAGRLKSSYPQRCVRLHHSDEGKSPRHHIPEDLQRPETNSRVYLCGPNAFMSSMTERAIAFGWSQNQIHQEAFSVDVNTATNLEDSFEVQLHSSGQVVRVPADQSIAQALLAASIEVPLSCEQGFCGACLTPVLQGTPCHRDSVLSDGEKLLNNQMTLCCSRSLSSRLVLDL